ncbi:hypothetical protein J132_04285, partial [Termitomyces sp. J132]
TIVVSEATHLIWKMRCNWQITKEADLEKLPSKNETTNRFKATTSKKLRLDCLTTEEKHLGGRATSAEVVKNTWKNFLPKDSNPLKSWRKAAKVLVGIG